MCTTSKRYKTSVFLRIRHRLIQTSIALKSGLCGLAGYKLSRRKQGATTVYPKLLDSKTRPTAKKRMPRKLC